MIDYWFPTPIWSFEINEINNKQIIDYAEALSKTSPGRVFTNCGGWQSNDFMINNCQHEELLKLSLLVERKGLEIASELELKPNLQLRMANFWLNVNKKGHFNRHHSHPSSFLSASYYVKAPQDCGQIIFEHPFPFMDYWWNTYTAANTYASHLTVSYRPKPGLLVIFPSWLLHRVEANASEELRISVSFNMPA
jgi:uncharacterized protein (TIGR02466 family)